MADDGPTTRETSAPIRPVVLDEAGRGILARQRDGLPATSEHTARAKVSAYVTTGDRALLALGCLGCIVGGALNPLLTVIYGQLVGSFDEFTNGEIDGLQLRSQVARFSLYFVYLAIGMFVFIYMATLCVFFVGDRVTTRLRLDYLRAVLRQNMAFFDVLGTGKVSSSLTADVHLVQEAISGKVSLTLTAAATCVTALIVTFVESWRLALVLMSTVAAMTAVNLVGSRLAIRLHKRALEATARGNAVAEEALMTHRHVAAFGILDELAERYASHLRYARGQGLRARYAVALMTAAFMGIMYLSSGLSFWEGSRLLVAGDISASGIVTCSMAVIISALTVGKVAPNAQAFFTGIAGASRLLDCIKRRSSEDPFDASGTRLDKVVGKIDFENVRLVYPSRPEVVALDGLDVSFPAGKMTAVIGASGCGKSSTLSLIERFYEPISGSILLDGVNVRDLNLSWLRQQMSLVSQEPILLNTSVFENIRHGLVGRQLPQQSEDQIRELVVQAARTANAHDFIEALPCGYETQVGQLGAELSGGQRQRVAIARAIVGDPKILLLDEPTAALDTQSERLVLGALERASSGRTTIFITHRLSSVQHADQIVVVSQGRVVEKGTHESLATKADGFYAAALEKQGLLVSTKGGSSDVAIGSGAPSSVDLSVSAYISPKVPSKMDEKTPTEIAHTAVTESRSMAPGSYSLWSLVKLASSLNRPELPFVLAGLVCCLLSGAINPVQSLFFAHSIDSLSLPPGQYSVLRSQIDFWSLMYLMLGIVAFITWAGQGTCLAYCSEALTFRARSKAFRTIMGQDVAFFDRPGHTTGALMKVLSTSAAELAGLGGAVLSTILTALATLAGGIILSLVIGWKLALVCTSTIPVVLTCGWLRLRVLSSMEAKVRAAYADSAAYAAEAITAIRTVSSLCLEEHVLETYESIVSEAASTNLRSTLYASALYAASQSAVFLVAALGFWYGGTLIEDHSYTILQYFVCFAALVSGSQSVGAVFSFAPDMSKAMHGGRDFRRLFDEKPAIDIMDNGGRELKDPRGAIELRGVSFRYPNRPSSYALRGFNLTVQPKQTVALVGHSGCGKSTVISLLERFIDPTSGTVAVDGIDLRTLNLRSYRSLLSLVGQEPVLYQATIRENLLLGVGRTGVTEEEIQTACREANVDEFIQSLPDGLATEVGSRGVMLSGGQKQRIAIARALLRNSPILLLDEATSALDGQSEAAVQQALDSASRNRTTIVVAHRLRTIRHADLICVMEHGSLVEQGTHEQLMKLGGRYADMVQLQSLEESRPDLPTLDE